MKDTFTSVLTPPPTFSLLTSISVQKYKKQLKWECGTNINSSKNIYELLNNKNCRQA